MSKDISERDNYNSYNSEVRGYGFHARTFSFLNN